MEGCLGISDGTVSESQSTRAHSDTIKSGGFTAYPTCQVAQRHVLWEKITCLITFQSVEEGMVHANIYTHPLLLITGLKSSS